MRIRKSLQNGRITSNKSRLRERCGLFAISDASGYASSSHSSVVAPANSTDLTNTSKYTGSVKKRTYESRLMSSLPASSRNGASPPNSPGERSDANAMISVGAADPLPAGVLRGAHADHGVRVAALARRVRWAGAVARRSGQARHQPRLVRALLHRARVLRGIRQVRAVRRRDDAAVPAARVSAGIADREEPAALAQPALVADD